MSAFDVVVLIIAIIAVCLVATLVLLTIFSKKKNANTSSHIAEDANKRTAEEMLDWEIEKDIQKYSKVYTNNPNGYVDGSNKR